jgi:hypothetical protein
MPPAAAGFVIAPTASTGICCLCRCPTGDGLALFLEEAGKREPVCQTCGRKRAPALAELLDVRAAIVAKACAGTPERFDAVAVDGL